jgi:transmembrane sensor
MENRLTNYTDLINKHLAGETSPDEALTLSAWINADPKNLAHYHALVETWNIIETSVNDPKIDIEKEWEFLNAKMDNDSVANESNPLPIKPQSQGFHPLAFIREKQSSKFSNHVSYLRGFKIAAVFLLFAIPSFLLYRYFTRPEMLEITAQANVIENHLSDGTSVTLNRGSTIEYPETFSGKTRDVTLRGEAFFQVKHDRKKPFIITSGDIKVEVLGTTFYVNTNPGEEKLNVVLTTGSVAVYYADDPSGKVILHPGEKAVVSNMGKEISRSPNEDPNYLAWKTGTLIFNGIRLSEIIPLLNKIYQSNIILTNPKTGECLVSATFHQQSLTSVLNVLKATLDLKIKNRGATIEISDGCK